MIYCLDTDVLIELFRGNTHITNRIKILKENDRVATTWFSVFEFFKGIYLSKQYEDIKFLEAICSRFEVYGESFESSRLGGEIYAHLRDKGQIVNDADILIASTALANDCILVTGNIDHFKRIPHLKIENWLK